MDNLTKPLETATRKKIDIMLNNEDWKTDEFSKDCNVSTERAKTTEQNNKLKKLSGYKKPPDYVLYETDTDNPIAIIETKRKGQSIDDALEQAIGKYAIPLGIKIVFAYDGAFFKSWHIEKKKELYVDETVVSHIISEKKLLKFITENANIISEITSLVKHTRQELISIFKKVNNLLRKEGLDEGKERFYEFSNILFLKLISEIEIEREINHEKRIISEDFCWNKFCKKEAKDMHYYVNNTVLKELRDVYGDIFDNQLNISAKTLKTIVDELSEINLLNIESDVKGDAFEYFLKTSITIGNDLGQYFTPRHIVKLMIELIEPKYGETIYDPACGTGGFLILAFDYLKRRSAKTPAIIEKLKNDTIVGRELAGIAKIAKMNMIITGDGHTGIEKIDSLEHKVEGKYDVVMANPPYGLDTDFGHYYDIPSNNGDVVFMEHIIDSLIEGGRAAVVISEGLLFSPNDVKKLRREILLKKCNIEAIISLPYGVFRPYTKNKTDIIIFQKDKKGTDSIWFYDLKKDGFETNSDLRRPEEENDIPDLKSKWMEKPDTENSWNISIEEIEKNNYDLMAKTYKPKKQRIKSTYPQEKFYTIMKENKEKITIHDDVQYMRLNIKWYGNGVFLRDDIKGKKIKMKKQTKVKTNQFVVAEIDAKNGSFGIIPEDLDGAIVSSHYFVFDLDTDKIIPKYLDYLIRLGDYTSLIQKSVKGTTQYASIRPDVILDLDIPLPDITIQKDIIQRLQIQDNLRDKAMILLDTLKSVNVDDVFFASKKKLPFTKYVKINPKYEKPKLSPYMVLEMEGVDQYTGDIRKFTKKLHAKSTSKFKNNDVLFAKMTNGKTTKIATVNCLKDNEIGLGSSEFVVLSPDSNILPMFLFFFCKSNVIKKKIKETIRGTTRQRIPPNFFNELSIPDISISKQEEIIIDLEKYVQSKIPLERLIKTSQNTMNQIVKLLFEDSKIT